MRGETNGPVGGMGGSNGIQNVELNEGWGREVSVGRSGKKNDYYILIV